jgi:hypothetical protein
VKRELPKLRQELNSALEESEGLLKSMGDRRSSAEECKQFLTDLSMRYFQTCKAAIDGYYEGKFFHSPGSTSVSSIPIRTRAKVQELNFAFNDMLIQCGHKYHFEDKKDDVAEAGDPDEADEADEEDQEEEEEMELLDSISEDFESPLIKPIEKTQLEAFDWVRQKLRGSRGKELAGNYNPLLIGELFWEQSERWASFAEHHIDLVLATCKEFLLYLLEQECPKDIQDRIWAIIDDELKRRKNLAYEELAKIMADLDDYPINYNHYYTDNIAKLKAGLDQAALARCIEESSVRKQSTKSFGNTTIFTNVVNAHDAAAKFFQRANANMETAACNDALVSMRAIYKVSHSHSTPRGSKLTINF